jgi:hypothetical protein
MGATVKVKVNHRNIARIMKGEVGSARKLVTDLAEEVVKAAGPGHAFEVDVGRNRIRAGVFTVTTTAKRAESTKRKLTRAVASVHR